MKNDYKIDGNVVTIYCNHKEGVEEVIVDLDDLERLLTIDRTICVYSQPKSYTKYAVFRLNNKNIRLHRYILKAKKGRVVDHINHNGLDNRKSNLREVCKKVNGQNRTTTQRNNTSGVTGVVFHKSSGLWYSEIKVDGKRIHLGYSKEFDEAVEKRKQAESKYFSI